MTKQIPVETIHPTIRVLSDEQLLAIHNASVDIDLVVDVGGVAGASAKFNLQIGPVATD